MTKFDDPHGNLQHLGCDLARCERCLFRVTDGASEPQMMCRTMVLEAKRPRLDTCPAGGEEPLKLAARVLPRSL